MEWFSNTSVMPIFWLALGLILLILEVLGASGFVLGAAVAAIAMAVITFAIDMPVVFQVSLYAVAAVIGTLIYFKFFRNLQPQNDKVLPSRSERLVGTRFTLDEPVFESEDTRVQLGDTVWRVTADEDIDKGTPVKVVDADAMRLTIEPAAD